MNSCASSCWRHPKSTTTQPSHALIGKIVAPNCPKPLKGAQKAIFPHTLLWGPGSLKNEVLHGQDVKGSIGVIFGLYSDYATIMLGFNQECSP